MKKKAMILAGLLALLLPVTFTSCSDTEDTPGNVIGMVSFPNSTKKVPLVRISKSDLPWWLIEKVSLLTPWTSGEDSNWLTTYTYAGTWQSQTVYLIYNPLMSSFYYHLYDAEGTRLEQGDNKEIIEHTGGWKCIIISGDYEF